MLASIYHTYGSVMGNEISHVPFKIPWTPNPFGGHHPRQPGHSAPEWRWQPWRRWLHGRPPVFAAKHGAAPKHTNSPSTKSWCFGIFIGYLSGVLIGGLMVLLKISFHWVSIQLISLGCHWWFHGMSMWFNLIQSESNGMLMEQNQPWMGIVKGQSSINGDWWGP